MTIRVSDPFPVVSDLDGAPLESGYVYIGDAGLDAEAFPKAVFWDKARTVAATQPIRTIAGRFVDTGSQIGNLYTDGEDYSITIKDVDLVTVYSAQNETGIQEVVFYDTVADMVAADDLELGEFVETRGYFSAGDGGANTYEVVNGGTEDGGSIINMPSLPGTLKVRGVFKGNTLNARQFGIPVSGDASVQLTAADAFMQTMKDFAQTPAQMTLTGYIELAEPVTLGGAVQRMNFDFSTAHIQVITGGTLESSGDSLYAITLDSKRSISTFAVIDCDRLCGGIHYRDCGGSKISAPRVERHGWRGHYLSGNNSSCTLYKPSGYQWGNTEVLGDPETIYTATGLYLDSTDVFIIGGALDWSKYPMYIGSGGGGDIVGVHLSNGNPDVGEPGETLRDNPFVLVSECGQSINFHDCYFDNGYIWDKTGRVTIQGGRHLLLDARVTLTDPLMRVNMRPDPSTMPGTVSDFDTSLGFMPDGADWVNDASNLVTDIAVNGGGMRGNSYKVEHNRKMTRIIPTGNTTGETQIVKQGDGTATITETYYPGTGDTVKLVYTAGRMEVKGSIRPETDSTYQLGTAAVRWSSMFADELDTLNTLRLRTAQTPATAGAAGNQGQIAWDANYIYICTATNTWKRVAIATW